MHSKNGVGVSPTSALLRLSAPPPFLRDLLRVAQGEPHGLGWDSAVERFRRGLPAELGQYEGGGQDPGVGAPEFVVHQSPKFTGAHREILARL